MSSTRPLTPMQQRFVDEYLVDRRPRAAALRAGYRSAKNVYRLIRRPGPVWAAIEAALADDARKKAVETYEIIDALRSIAFAPERQVAAKERLAAIGLLGKHLGLFGDKPGGDQLTRGQIIDLIR